MFFLNFLNLSIGTIAPVALVCPPPVANSMSLIASFVTSNAFVPRIEMFAFSGRLNATTVNLSG